MRWEWPWHVCRGSSSEGALNTPDLGVGVSAPEAVKDKCRGWLYALRVAMQGGSSFLDLWNLGALDNRQPWVS